MQDDRSKLIVLAAAVAVIAVAVLAIVIARGGEDDGGKASGGAPDDLSAKPAVEVPDGEPPKELETEDIVDGDGKAARKGDQIEVQYVGVSQSTGEEFDASWGKGEPFAFELGAGNVIPGWDQGIAGMKVGGRRRLIIPPDLAYGAEGQPPDIGPSETLIFIVDLKKVG